MDRIEKSNLSRQFLFRNTDIDKFKSATAADAAKAMNPQLNITPYQEKVAPETEHLFGDDFYDKRPSVHGTLWRCWIQSRSTEGRTFQRPFSGFRFGLKS